MDRRDFMAIGGVAAAFFGASAANAGSAPLPAGGLGRSVTDFGVEPNTERDQSAAMQKAIDEIAAAGQPVFIPGGRYRASGLKLPPKSALLGAPGFSALFSGSKAPILEASPAQDVALRGLTFNGAALMARGCKAISVIDCQVLASEGDGLVCGGSSLLISNNRVSGCAASGIRAEGDGIVTGNFVEGGGQFGLRLGGADKLGTITAINNMIRGAEVGIAVSNADGGYALISMNMIVGARGGGIRALNGDELIGKDLAKNFSSDSFRNLAIAANVSV